MKQEPVVPPDTTERSPQIGLSAQDIFNRRVYDLLDAFCERHYWQTGRHFHFLGRQSRQYYHLCLAELVREKLGWSPAEFVEVVNHRVNRGHRQTGTLRPQYLCSGLAVELILENLSQTMTTDTICTEDIDPLDLPEFDFRTPSSAEVKP